MALNLIDKTVLVTGGASGIGLAFTQLAARSGANVIVIGRNPDALSRAKAELPGIETHSVDLADRADLQRLLASLDARGVQVDVLVNNAGAGASGPFIEDDPGKLRAMLDLNIIALTDLTGWAARAMAKRGTGAIINLSAAVATRPVPGFAAYSASKAYVTNLSVALAQELKGTGVTVTAVHPPAVATSFSEAGRADIRSTWVFKLFGPLGPSPVSVAATAFRAAMKGRKVVNSGPLAWAIYRSGFIMPNVLDLPIMAALFRHRGSPANPVSDSSTLPARAM